MEEIHIVIRYPINPTWVKLDIVENVRSRTIGYISDLVENLWTGATVEEINHG